MIKKKEWPVVGGEAMNVPEHSEDDDKLWVLPSPIDVHVHFREPSKNETDPAETIASGSAAARAGGYQAAMDMPNNDIPTHSLARVHEKHRIARKDSVVDFGAYAGVDLAKPDLRELKFMMPYVPGLKLYMGVTTGNQHSYSLEDTQPVIDYWIKTARELELHAPILLHALGKTGIMAAEYIARQEHPVHWCHVSSRTEAAHAQIFTEKYGEFFTAGVTPHHLTMTKRNADFQQGWNAARMQPPLRNERDARALLYAYNEGFIQILETDHAPHKQERKLEVEQHNPEGRMEPSCDTCFGVSGIEFALPVMSALVKRKLTTRERVEDSLYAQPKRMLGLPEDSMPSRTIVELEPGVIETSDIVGNSRNTPYVGWMSGGRVIGYEEEKDEIEIIKAQPRRAA